MDNKMLQKGKETKKKERKRKTEKRSFILLNADLIQS